MGPREFRLAGGTLIAAFLGTILSLSVQRVSAQTPNAQDQVIDAIRSMTDIGASDQRRIARWVEAEFGSYSDLSSFRQRFQSQYINTNNSQEFSEQFATQVAQAAVNLYSRSAIPDDLSYAIAVVLVDLNRQETYSGFLAGLKSGDPATRYVCARGLVSLRLQIGTDDAMFAQAQTALATAGMVEQDAVVLRRIYEALAYPTRAQDVIETYIAIFEKRLAIRRGPATVVDGAEVFAFEFLSQPGVYNALSTEQKQKLVSIIAVFMRLDAERYNVDKLGFIEIDLIERSLTACEEILAGLVGLADRGVRDALDGGAHSNRTTVLQEAYKWTGHPINKANGVLNAAPWNVPVGAP